jgi:hypothetical protein
MPTQPQQTTTHIEHHVDISEEKKGTWLGSQHNTPLTLYFLSVPPVPVPAVVLLSPVGVGVIDTGVSPEKKSTAYFMGLAGRASSTASTNEFTNADNSGWSRK